MILRQQFAGGTNVLLAKAHAWLVRHDHIVADPDDRRVEALKAPIDLLLLPTSELYQVVGLRAAGFPIERILVWAMGSRAFHGAFYDPMNRSRAFRFAMFPLKVLAETLLGSLLRQRAVVFTDEVGFHSDLGSRGSARQPEEDLIYPIAIEPAGNAVPRHSSSRPRRFAWVGRIDDDFKVLPLLRVIRDVAADALRDPASIPTRFLIVGSGNSDRFIRTAITAHPHLEFEWLPFVANDLLARTLAEKTDVLFAMGTSALEGARCGVPTVVVQPFTTPGEEPAFPYRWIGDTVGHSLGEFTWAPCQPAQPKCAFDSLWNDGSLQQRGRESLAFSGKFDAQQVFERLFHRRPPQPLTRWSLALLHLHTFQRRTKRNLRSFFSGLRPAEK